MTNKTQVAAAEVCAIAQRLSAMQQRQMQVKARLSVIRKEANTLEAELSALQSEHLELLRKFDAAAKLP